MSNPCNVHVWTKGVCGLCGIDQTAYYLYKCAEAERDAALDANARFKKREKENAEREFVLEASRDTLRDLLREVLHATSANMSMDMYAKVCAAIDAAVNALPALLDRLAAAERDAERYRWLRANFAELVFDCGGNDSFCNGSPDELDAAIDAARAKVQP